MVRPALLFGITFYLSVHVSSEQQTPQLQPPASASCAVYILDMTCATRSAAIPLGRALARIGYSPHRPYDALGGARMQNGLQKPLPPNSYTCLSLLGGDYAYLARQNPKAKFITHGAGDDFANAGNDTWAQQWDDMRHFFSQAGHSSQLLVVDVHAPEQASQAENWEKICVFLGLGYSMVERMGLWLLS